MIDSLPPALLAQISQKRCALFVGPDTAETAGGYRGLPTSWHLAEALAARCDYRGQYRPLPQIARIYEHKRSRQDLIDYLRQLLADPDYRPLPIHELMARIPFPVIVHAGWDNLLEQALEGQNTPYQVIYSIKEIPYQTADRLLIYKPYGSLERPDLLVITEDDQLNMNNQLSGLKTQLANLIASYSLFMVGYAPDYDSVFVRIYHEIRQAQEGHNPPDFVVGSLSRPEDALQWAARGIEPITAEPVTFLYNLAQNLVATKAYDLALPDLASLSQASTITSEEQANQTATFNRVLETFGIGDLVEQSDIPLFTAAQTRDLDVMREAYERLMAGAAGQTADSAHVWLRQGNIEYVRQNYQNARRYYQKALEAQPTLAEAYHNLHYIALAEDKLEEAFQAYEQSITLDASLAFFPAHYRLEAVLGRGGMGVVYKAFDQINERTVAIKVLARAHLRTERLITRFQREATILQRLQHPHIVRCLDFQNYQGSMFLVLEYLGEQTLAQRLAEKGVLSLDEAHALLQQACQALIFTHQHDIIHRDLKPANIFLVGNEVKLIDFGLAVDLNAGQPSLIGLATGTVDYMAPEQLAGGQVDERTDIYALATIFYEMITGRHPGQGTYRAPDELVPGLNDSLNIVLQKAREREPENRYANMADFCQELAQVIPLQPASQQSGWIRPRLAKVDQFLQTHRLGLFIAAIVTWLFLGDWPLLGDPGECGTIWVGGVLLWDAVFASFWIGLVTKSLTLQSGYASPFGYRTLMGAIVGLWTGLVASLMAPETMSPAWVDLTTSILTLLSHTIIVGIVGTLLWGLLTAGTKLAMRRGVNPTFFVRVSYGLVILGVGVFGLLLYWFVCIWG